MLLRAFILALVLRACEAYMEVAGSCMGPASVHVPPDAGSGLGMPGPYSIKIDGITRGGDTVCEEFSGCQTMTMGTMHILSTGRRSVDKPEKHTRRHDDEGDEIPGCWSGFLIKALDAATGLPLPAFASTPMPSNTDLFEGCTDKRSAITHTAYMYWCSWSMNITWPSDREVTIQAFLVEDEERWYEVYGSSAPTFVPAEMDCPRKQLHSLPAIAVGFSPVVVILLCAAALKHVPGLRSLSQSLNQKGATGSAPSVASNWVVSMLSFDVIPRAFEMSVGEWIAYVFFFACQIVSLVLSILSLSDSAKTFVKSTGSVVTLSPWDATFARALGQLTMINMAIACFLPTRNSALGHALGISFERMIKYHRVVGRFSFVLVLLHGAVQMAFWGVADCFSMRRICFGHSNLFGALSGILFIISMVGSLQVVRRKLFEVFLISHMLNLPAMVLACLHVYDFFFFLIAPLALYLLDWALRISQWMRSSAVVKAEVLEGGVVRLEIECPAVAKAIYDLKEGGLGTFVFVRCWQASMNPMELHPFTVSGLLGTPSAQPARTTAYSAAPAMFPPGPPAPPNVPGETLGYVGGSQPPIVAAPNVTGVSKDGKAWGITVHIKRQGDGQWTDRLAKAVEGGKKLTVALEGPFGDLSVDIKAYGTIVCFAGGIGITPFAHLLQMFMSRKEECFPNAAKLVIVWCVQNMAQTACFSQLLDEAERWSGPAKIEILIHATREGKGQEMRSMGGKSVVKMECGRPDIGAVLNRLCDGGDKASTCCAISCGPITLVDTVRSECRRVGAHNHFETFWL
mmetsp:Transcript_8827/g.23024  ORF Transcript_8827/g.23024 Transcript_8827/m.23024 type:complete len:798 (-) Transcript_8827:88-2481(-)